jgi:DNA-binding SARP family transcriptional activator
MGYKRFYLLGEFRCVCGAGQPVEIGLSKEIGVIALLALANDHSCARGRIIDLLWSDRCGEQGRSSLRHALWSLKKKLNRESPHLLRIDRRRVFLDVDGCDIDTREFTKLAASDRRQDLENAISIYRGDLLEDLVINDREWEAWLGIERHRLQMIYADCLHRLSKRHLANRDINKLLATGLRLIAHNPLWEEGHRALMEAYSLARQKSLALRQYERYRDMIHRELDSHPEPSIERLYERIKRGRFSTSR